MLLSKFPEFPEQPRILAEFRQNLQPSSNLGYSQGVTFGSQQSNESYCYTRGDDGKAPNHDVSQKQGETKIL